MLGAMKTNRIAVVVRVGACGGSARGGSSASDKRRSAEAMNSLLWYSYLFLVVLRPRRTVSRCSTCGGFFPKEKTARHV